MMMKFFNYSVLFSSLLFLGVVADGNNETSGSYWVVYGGDAPDSCVKADGEMVDDSCCTSVGPQFGLIADSYDQSCFVIAGLLGENGGSLMSYLGCNGDENTPTYGEACYNGGENGGLIPPGMLANDTNPDTMAQCGSQGCQFSVTGNGCHVIRDFSSLPGFENDTRQVFLYMEEHCEEKEKPSPTSAATTTALPMAVSALWWLLGMVV